MISGATCHNMDLAQRPDLVVAHAQLFNHDPSVFNARIQRVADGLWLFVHLLKHKMLIAAFFRRIDIPFDLFRLFFDLFTVDIVKADCILF